ncbi:MAG: alpha-ribazole phosphatase [Bacteroidota bacterium]
MVVYLIRHTTPNISKEICYGQSDIALAKSFHEEVQVILPQLPDKVDEVYTSPLSRCLQLAEIIPHKMLKEVPQLQEMNFGEWEMKQWNDIPEDELNPWMENFVNEQVPNGESMQLVADRVIGWYSGLQFDGKKVAIVTHAGPLRILLSHINQTPLEEAFQRYKVEYGEVIVI